MPLAPNIALARVLAGGAGRGVDIYAGIEERGEREQELARAVKGRGRARQAERQMGQGRLFGSLFGGAAGFLGKRALLSLLGGAATGGVGTLVSLLPALLTAAGSYGGQKVQTRKTAKEKLGAIDVGSFRRARGRERETEFRAGERDFREALSAGIRGRAVQDFMSALAFQNLDLSRLFGRGAKEGVSFGVKPSLGMDLPGEFLPSSMAGLGDIERSGIISILRELEPDLSETGGFAQGRTPAGGFPLTQNLFRGR